MSTMSTQLSWSHYVELLNIDDHNKINYYIDISQKNNLSVRELRTKIKNKNIINNILIIINVKKTINGNNNF